MEGAGSTLSGVASLPTALAPDLEDPRSAAVLALLMRLSAD